ncbi:heme peroxidase [Cristinia sonorae]|uniref:Peroxidase n=1 Tax=Cristinia sonorae TaxID=1940300 RepID=A0A8K0UQV1_9AGAR|nr:heme peroxidase [Cristinia sonorae]
MPSARSEGFLGHVFVITLLSSLALAKTSILWPNPKLDELESQLYDREGYRSGILGTGMLPTCITFFDGPNTGRANVGDWVRTAYHDMATYNSTDGTGGLDGSIRFPEELSRSENAGDGFTNTLRFITPGLNRYFSVADGIAMAAVVAIEMCGGPAIPFRGGRIDALKPNDPGVPEPQQSIEEHISNFARQGFTQEEMISLVACGHTFGGVQHTAFPDIAPPSNDANNTSGNAPFDSTFVEFDNKIATEYLDGTTKNPLVVGHNSTTNSDLRIFSSDNNATMFSDPAVFRSTCSSLFARMIDTVPKGIILSDVITPILFKPVEVQLVWVGGGNVELWGQVRVWNNLPSQLTHNAAHVTKPHIPGSPGILNTWVEFPQIVLNATESISTFWFEVMNGDSFTKVEDLGGSGYPLQDVVMMSTGTCYTMKNGVLTKLQFAIRADIQPTRVYARYDYFEGRVGFGAYPVTGTFDIARPSDVVTTAGYEIWNVETRFGANPLTIIVEANGEQFETTFTKDSPFRPGTPGSGHGAPLC